MKWDEPGAFPVQETVQLGVLNRAKWKAHGNAIRAAGGSLGEERASWKPAERIFFPARVQLNAD